LEPCHRYGSLGERDRASVVDSDGLLLVLGGGSLIDDEDTTSNCGQSTPLCILALLEATAKIYCNEQLYNAIVRECPDEIILALLATNIEAAKKLDLDGNLPLLKTNECKSSDDVVSSLLAAEKSIALIYEGKYFFYAPPVQWKLFRSYSPSPVPFHVAIQYVRSNNLQNAIECKCSDEVILTILEANEEAVSNLDYRHRSLPQSLPLINAIESKCSEEVVLALFD